MAQKGKKCPDISKRMKQQWQDPAYRASRTGKKNPMYRKKHTEEAKKKISLSKKDKPSPKCSKRMKENNPMKRPEVVAKISGENSSSKRPEVRAKMSVSHLALGENHPMKRPEQRKRQSERMKGEKNPNYGGLSNEHKQKLSLTSKRVVKTAEWNLKNSIGVIKRIILNGGRNHGLKGSKQGKFYSHKNQDFIFYDSSYELRFFGKLEDDTSVKQYMRCPYVIDYTFDGGQRKYLPDILVEYTNDKREIIEVKPSGRVFEEQNLTKFAAAREFCKENKMTFAIVTEKEL